MKMLIERLRNSKFKSLCYKWMYSYMLLAVLLFAVMILFYMLSKSSITRAIDKNYSLMLSQITTIMDAHLNNGKTVASGFFNDRNIKDIATNGKDRFSLRSVDSAIHIKNELERYTLLFRDANSAFIFFPEAELLISADGIRRLDLFSLTENTYDFESGLMESITAGKELEECMVGGNYITLTIPVSIGKNRAYLVYPTSYTWVQKNALTEAFADSSNGTVFAIALNKNVYVNQNGNFTLIGTANELKSDDMIWLSETTDAAGLSLMIGVPTDEYMYLLKWMRDLLLILLVCGAAVSLALSFFMTERQYKPIKEISSFLRDTNGAEEVPGDEYDFISSNIRQLKKRYEITALTNEEIEQKLAVTLLLQKSSISGSVMKKLGISDKCSHFNVVLVRVDDEGIYSDEHGADEHCGIIVQNIIGELLYGDGPRYIAEIGQSLAFLLCSKTSNMQAAEKLEYAVSAIYDNFQIICTAIVGTEVESINNIRDVYFEVVDTMDAARYAVAPGKVLNIPALDMSFSENISGSDLLALQRKIFNSLMLMNYEEAENLIIQLIEAPASGKSETILRNRILFLSDFIARVIDEQADKTGSALPEKLIEKLDHLTIIRTKEEFIAATRQILKLLKRSTEEKLKGREGSDVIRYIYNNAYRSDMNISQIIETLDISQYDLSRIVMQHSGLTPLNFIQQLRMEKAKELLIDTDRTVASIAEMSGFSNDLALIRAFKKYEGITPSQYRKKDFL